VLQPRISGAPARLSGLLPSWQLALESDNKSPKTIKGYLASVRSLATFLRANDMPAGIEDVTTEGIRALRPYDRAGVGGD
jgi:hypothetical protein